MRKNKFGGTCSKMGRGKRQVIDQITKYVPDYSSLYEPFSAAGASFIARYNRKKQLLMTSTAS